MPCGRCPSHTFTRNVTRSDPAGAPSPRKRGSGCLAPPAAASTSAASKLLRLRPMVVDGRTIIELPRVPGSELHLGRSSTSNPNTFGIQDPRVSRKHVHVAVEAPGQLRVRAVGSNPIQVMFAADGSTRQLPKGASALLQPGDGLQLVCEETVRELQGGNQRPNADAWSGNLCCYSLELLDMCAASTSAMDVSDDLAPVSSSAGAVSSPAKVQRLAAAAPAPAAVPATAPPSAATSM